MFNTELNNKILHTRLVAEFVQQSNEKVTLTEAMKIVDKLDLEENYSIEVVIDWKEFQNMLTLTDDEFSHSWAGERSVKEEGRLLLTDGSPEDFLFGLDYSRQYSENGDYRSPNTEYQLPRFEIDKRHVVQLSKEVHDHFNGNHIDSVVNSVVFYLPVPDTDILD